MLRNYSFLTVIFKDKQKSKLCGHIGSLMSYVVNLTQNIPVVSIIGPRLQFDKILLQCSILPVHFNTSYLFQQLNILMYNILFYFLRNLATITHSFCM